MPLFIKDPGVAEMAEKLRKTHLRAHQDRGGAGGAEECAEGGDREAVFVRQSAHGGRHRATHRPGDPDFDQKRFSDEMWGA